MNIAFFGDDHYSAIILRKLLSFCNLQPANCKLQAIITSRPKPKGRDAKIEINPVEKIASTHNIKVLYYPDKKDEMNNFISHLQSTVDHLPSRSSAIGVLASFGHILPIELLRAFPEGIINVHPSLLPQYRGATPVQHAIALGDTVTGVTLFTLTETIDDGRILAQAKEDILPTDTTPALSDRLFKKGADLLLDLLADKLHSQGDLDSSDYPQTGFARFQQSPSKLVRYLFLKIFRRFSGLVSALTEMKSENEDRHAPLERKNYRFSRKTVTNQIFTRTFTRDDGFLEWPVFLKLLNNEPVTVKETANELLKLRLQKIETKHLEIGNWKLEIARLWRALNPWPGIWTIAKTKKGNPRVSLVPCSHSKLHTAPCILIAGKPNPTSWPDFEKYYL